MSRRARARCPFCHLDVRARWEGAALRLARHRRPGLYPVANATCRGSLTVAPDATLPVPRPISYEETVRLIDTLLEVAPVMPS